MPLLLFGQRPTMVWWHSLQKSVNKIGQDYDGQRLKKIRLVAPLLCDRICDRQDV